MSIALRHKQHSETLVHAHSISFLDTLCTPEPLWTRAFPQAHKEHAETPCPQGCLSTFTPFIQTQHLNWSDLLRSGLSRHIVIDLSYTNSCGVKKQEIWRGTDREKVETDVWGDSYSKISWDLFAGILFWLVVVHGEVFSTQPLW